MDHVDGVIVVQYEDGLEESAPSTLLRENESRSLDSHGLPFLVVHRAYKVRSIYEASQSKVEEQPCLIRSFSREQINQ